MNPRSRYVRWLSGLLACLALLPAAAERRMTDFDPSRDGFGFVNDFRNDVVREFDIRTGGLCGGMVYTALDYYHADMDITRQTHRPAVNTRLHDYIYDRQVQSIAGNVDKWAEVGFNPFGARNGEFFNWGLQGFNGGRLQELRDSIDRGEPVPLGLWHYDGQRGGDHQVLAIGYDTGRYRGDLGAHREDLKIFIYDPNHPGVTKTLVPDVRLGGYRYTDEDKVWLTYFVDGKYRARRPPVRDDVRPTVVVAGPVVSAPAHRTSTGRVARKPVAVGDPARPAVIVTPPASRAGDAPTRGPTTRELLLTIRTGGDDLRGGHDNVDAVFRFRGQPPLERRNLNGGRHWIGNYDQTVRIRLPRAMAVADLQDLTLTTRFAGGISGDNWNVDCVRVVALTETGEEQVLLDARGAPLVRFTGERHVYQARLSP